MSISSALTLLNQDIQNARTAIVNKGGTVTSGGGSSQLATDIATIPSGSSGKYKLLDRVKDDSNNEIGTVSGFFTDVNDVEYAVVCLDAQYRYTGRTYSTTQTAVTNMPLYNNQIRANAWESKVTATTNTDLILASVTSPACNHCRSKSFTIDGITYYGQLPNVIEVSDIAKNYNTLENLDTFASQYSGTNFSSARTIWASNQYTATNAWRLATTGAIRDSAKDTSLLVCPVLEIPNGE